MAVPLRRIIGLDLGQQADFTALALLESQYKWPQSYDCPALKRWPLGTSYTTIVDDLVSIFRRRPELNKSMLVVDQTGVGRPVVEMIRNGLLASQVLHGGVLVGVTITGGSATTVVETGQWHVPKRVLVSNLSVLLQGKRLRVAPSLPDARVLVREMQTLKVKITLAGNETFEAWRERDHDDLVLAVALAAWAGENVAWVPARD